MADLTRAFRRFAGHSSDVPDVLMRLPECWCVVPGAQLEGLHDDEARGSQVSSSI
ncbi:hypothetical protein [Paraburkholderia lycopersici]|uniref:Uncharacterized protein n=1 Tax=Paraburkholderia lycopersici TaxID=416944 RepID=A0A1G6W256_9BURK|nr:hypothetical protein [Paraburkholderia lycopersici]SDD59921.1 hypothetical protein SAMN05421548_12234 [Paraburkholderia lycopersici]